MLFLYSSQLYVQLKLLKSRNTSIATLLNKFNAVCLAEFFKSQQYKLIPQNRVKNPHFACIFAHNQYRSQRLERTISYSTWVCPFARRVGWESCAHMQFTAALCAKLKSARQRWWRDGKIILRQRPISISPDVQGLSLSLSLALTHTQKFIDKKKAPRARESRVSNL